MLDSVLIANRGEIACRIIRTAKRLGMRTIAVHSDADARALFVAMADEAHPIGPAAARESYLDIGKIIAARESVRRRLHPSWLRLPVGARRVRRGLRRERDRLRRPAGRRRSAPWG